jgi:hypothetical protein
MRGAFTCKQRKKRSGWDSNPRDDLTPPTRFPISKGHLSCFGAVSSSNPLRPFSLALAAFREVLIYFCVHCVHFRTGPVAVRLGI